MASLRDDQGNGTEEKGGLEGEGVMEVLFIVDSLSVDASQIVDVPGDLHIVSAVRRNLQLPLEWFEWLSYVRRNGYPRCDTS